MLSRLIRWWNRSPFSKRAKRDYEAQHRQPTEEEIAAAKARKAKGDKDAMKDLPSGKRAKHMRTVRAAMTEEQRREESRKRAERRREQKRRDRAELNPEMFDAVVESV